MTMWQNEYKHLNEVWSTPLIDGIFTKLQLKDVPWKDENIANVLDMTYFYNHSGKKITSSLVDSLLDENDKLTTEGKQQLADVVYSICNENWKRVYKALFSEYNPIWNTDAEITEQEIRNLTGTNTGTNSTAHTGSDTHAVNGTDKLSTTGTDTLDKTGSNRESHTGTDKTTKTGSDTDAWTGIDTFGVAGTDNHTLTGSDSVASTGSDSVGSTGTDTENMSGSDKADDNVKITHKTEGDEKIYHHNFTTDHNDDNHGNTNITTTTTQIAGYNSGDFADSNKQTVKADSAIVHRTTNGEKNEAGALTDDEKSWHNADITDDDRTITEQHEGGISNSKHQNTSTTYDKTDTTTYGRTDTTTYGKSDNETYSHTDTTTYGKTDTITHNTEDVVTHGEIIELGLNSTDTTTYGKNENRILDNTDTLTYNSNEDVTNNVTTTDKGTVEHSTIRQGNIGVTTTQQMITEELQLRKTMFFERVFSDIDRYLTCPIY